MPQFHAGYILNPVSQLITKSKQEEAFRGLLGQLSAFEAKLEAEKAPHFEPCAISGTVANILSRGLPTQGSEFLHKQFHELYSHIPEWAGLFLTENPDTQSLGEHVFNALHIIDPRIDKDSQAKDYEKNWDRFGQEHREEFFYHLLPAYTSEALLQLFEFDQPLHTVLEHAKHPDDNLKQYTEGKTAEKIASTYDFTLEFPYPISNKQGLQIEIRDARKEKLEQRHTDNLRDKAAQAAGWLEPKRYRTTDFRGIKHKFRELREVTDSDFFTRITQNYFHPLYKEPAQLHALELALIPLGVARIQRMVLESLARGYLSLTQEKWRIGIIERDVPAAVLAIEDLKLWLRNLLLLYKGKAQLPTIDLTVFYTPEFAQTPVSGHNKKFREHNTYRRLSLEKYSQHTQFDLLLDVSLLLRKQVKTPNLAHNSKVFAKIRSIHLRKNVRAFLMHKPMAYPYAQESEEALAFFLKNIFGKKELLPGQARLLKLLLERKHAMGLLPPHGGKSIVFQLAALLQPGISVVIIPSSYLAMDQVSLQSQKGMAFSGRYSIVSQTPEERKRARKELLNASQLLLYSFAGNFHHQEYRQLMENMQAEGIPIAQYIIDEAHCASAWSHDFRLPYFHISQVLKQKHAGHPTPPVVALSSASTYPVVNDLKAQFQIPDQHVVEVQRDRSKLIYRMVPAKNQDIFYNTPVHKAQQTIARKKQVLLMQILGNIFGKEVKKNDAGKTLVVCPQTHGKLGIESAENDSEPGLAEKIKGQFPHLDVRSFSGSPENPNQQANRNRDRKNLREIYRTHTEKADILVATEDFGIGINFPTIHNIIYVNMPGSIEKFMQINGRSLRSHRESHSYLLYNNQPVASPAIAKKQEENDEPQTTTDRYINEQKLGRHFTNPEKELIVLQELLYEISFPQEKAEDVICEAIEEEYGVKVQLSYQPAKNPYQLYINHANKSFGYIDYRSYSNHTENATLDSNLGGRILNFTKKEIERLSPEGGNVFRWLQHTPESAKIPGILKIFNKVGDNEQASLSIHFRNDKLNHLQPVLTEITGEPAPLTSLRGRYNASANATDFLSQLQRDYPKATAWKEPETMHTLRDKVRKHYRQVREARDTFSALRKLMDCGIADDFTLDEHARIINLVISPKSKDFYIRRMQGFFTVFLTPSGAENYLAPIREASAQDLEARVLQAFIRFSYEVLYHWHKSNLQRMDELCTLGVRQASVEDTHTHLTQYLDYHLRAIYANPYLEASLYSDTQQVQEEKYKTVLKYLKETGDYKHRLHQLKGSALRMMEKNPKNYVLKLLYAYATLLLYPSPPQTPFFDAFDKLAEGAIRMQHVDNISYQDFMTKLNIILKRLYEKDGSLQQHIEPMLNLKIHYEWLKNFNTGFLKNYQEKYSQVY